MFGADRFRFAVERVCAKKFSKNFFHQKHEKTFKSLKHYFKNLNFLHKISFFYNSERDFFGEYKCQEKHFKNYKSENIFKKYIFSVQSLKHRAVVHFGHVFDYSTNSASEWKEADPIPPVINSLIDRLISDKYITERPDQVTANVYESGHGIPSHYDTHSAFDDPIVSIRFYIFSTEFFINFYIPFAVSSPM